MKLHEYQAKELFGHAGLPVPMGKVARTPDQAVQHADALGFPLAIKAQVHAGGRGKAGGIQVVADMDEAKAAIDAILGMTLQTAQTGTTGKKVSTILLEKGVDIDHEYYLSILPDRDTAALMIIASTEGGMNIEDVADKTPEKIIRVRVNPLIGIQPYHLRRIAFGLGLSGDNFKSFCSVLAKLYKTVIDNDLLLAEINPLALTAEGDFILLDAKVDVDSNSLFRHKELAASYDNSEDDPLELEARKYNLNYIRLSGNVGTMVNGAGLAMATMDIIKQAGAEPANFLDVGGGANAEMIENGFRILLSDKDVQAILINIFGGILRCDVLATGVVQAAKKIGLTLPVVVRMEGTNVDEGRRIMAESGLDLTTADDLQDAAEKISTIAGLA
ncbi:MAG: ADP-forming succinate--CoA ligase subunit beta [Desulfobulbus sp.]|nr:MAG: ADP-forming succinate--CoA ligase subunit beta [Desulfobulbus sp.]